MLLYEFRIPLPFSLKEYQVGQLFTVAEMSLNATGAGEGVELLRTEPFKGLNFRMKGYNSGTFTYKIYHMESKVPGFIRLLSDPGKFDVHEEAWNAFPYCRTYLTNPGYMKDSFFIEVESFHVDGDRGGLENALQLSKEELAMRKVIFIDIGNDVYTGKNDMKHDPATAKVRRGPLIGNWVKSVTPVMTAYKVVRTEFKFFGLQKRVEELIQVSEHRLFTQFHRQLFCVSDQWLKMNLNDIRKMEEAYATRINENMKKKGSSDSGYQPADLYDSKSTCLMNK